MTRPPFPHVIDSTLLAAFRSCPQSAYRAYFQHWKPKAESVHLVAGAAFARGIEVARRYYFDEKADDKTSVAMGLRALLESYGDFECPAESAKSAERTAGALEYYFTEYPLGADGLDPITLPSGKRAIEFSFAEPLDILHPVTGDPLLYSGRADCIGEFADGVYIVDEKTTSSLGQSWMGQWGLRSQFSAYCWAARRNGYKPTGVLVRGISILKTKYGTAQVATGRSEWEIERWYEQTLRDLDRMIQAWKSDLWDYNLDHACTEYGGCKFREICKSPNPDQWIPMYFERRVWDPLLREELPYTEEMK